MSSAFALAAVSAVIKNQIDNGLVDSGLNTTVSLLAPDKLTSEDDGDNKLNLFLYRVTPNQGWINNDRPSLNSKGERISNPKLALDLHYLITSSGSSDYQSEILLGAAMQILHNTPVLSRDAIKKALENDSLLPNSLTNGSDIKSSELDNQLEQIKITLQNLNIEEISKLWSSFQTNYRLSVSYLVTVVLIESFFSTKSALPVTGANYYAAPFKNPYIESIYSYSGGNTFITAGSKIIVKGSNFPTEDLEIYITDKECTGYLKQAKEKELVVEFDAPFPAGIYSGIQSLRIAGYMEMGTPPELHKAIESNDGVFIIHPVIEAETDDISDDTINEILYKKGKIKVEFNPIINKSQKITLYLNEFDSPSDRSAYSYSFAAPADNGIGNDDEESSEVVFSFKNVIPGKYLVRARVDGADSLLEQDNVSKKFNKPLIVI